MKHKGLWLITSMIVLIVGLSACSSINIPQVSVPAVDRQVRDFGDFSGMTVNLNGGISFDKISSGQPTGGGNIWPLFDIKLQNDRLILHLTDGRFVVNVGDLRSAMNFPEMAFIFKFSGGQGLTAPTEQKTLFVGPNLVDCVGVAPQKCMQVKDNPEDPWKLFYDQIEGFEYQEGYLYELKVSQSTVANPPADSSSLKLKLEEIVSQTEVTADLVDTTWNLETLAGKPPLPKSEVTAIFGGDGRLYGSAGCNSFNTSYQVGGNTITIQPPATTRMSCSQTGVMEQETNFLTALEQAKTFEIVGNRLTMSDAEGQALLTFMAEQP